jgi:hypothetical protein
LQLQDRPNAETDTELSDIRDALSHADTALAYLVNKLDMATKEEPEPFFKYEPRR